MATDLDEERQRVEAEERDLVFTRFTNDDAWSSGSPREKARARKLPIAIDIERGGQRLFHFALRGRPRQRGLDRAQEEPGPANVPELLRSRLKLAASNQTLEDNIGPAAAEYAAHGGCFPIVVSGVGFVVP